MVVPLLHRLGDPRLHLSFSMKRLLLQPPLLPGRRLAAVMASRRAQGLVAGPAILGEDMEIRRPRRLPATLEERLGVVRDVVAVDKALVAKAVAVAAVVGRGRTHPPRPVKRWSGQMKEALVLRLPCAPFSRCATKRRTCCRGSPTCS